MTTVSKCSQAFYFLITLLFGPLLLAADRVPSLPRAPTALAMNPSEWSVAYDGYGFVNFDRQSRFVEFAPEAASQLNQTHAALLLAKKYLQAPIKNFKITVSVNTERQLRTPKVNPWECFWLFFNYGTDSNGKKMTNYFTLKPNGIELGRAYEELGQKFLATAAKPRLVIGARTKITIENKAGLLKAWVNDILVLSFNSHNATVPLFENAGTIGLYTEDAQVKVETVDVAPI